MTLSNFNEYDDGDTKNFQGLNMLSNVFSVLFAVFNCYLGSMVVYDKTIKICLTVFVVVLVEFTIIFTSFIFEDMNYHTTVSLIIAIVYTSLMIPIFGTISSKVADDCIDEAKLSYQQRDGYRKMFDALQEGIIVVQDMKVSFMNELSNKVLSELTNLDNFFKNRDHDGDECEVDNMDQKLFYLLTKESDKKEEDIVIKGRGKKGKKFMGGLNEKEALAIANNEKTDFSIKDIIDMTVADLSGKVFTFDKKLISKDITKLVENTKNIDIVVKGLPSMKGIDDEYIPKFKFFQIKKSYIKGFQGSVYREMICFIDIS